MMILTKSLILLVPGERFELPTNGLQNRCSTTELTRRIGGIHIAHKQMIEQPFGTCWSSR